MYAWVYLTDFLAVQNLNDYLQENSDKLGNDKLFRILDDKFWEIADRRLVDPNFQLNNEAFQAISFLAAIARELKNNETISFVELGSTFFTSKDKFSIVESEATRLSIESLSATIEWTGIDNSAFANNAAKRLHQQQHDFSTITDWQDYSSRDKAISLFYSRFVCSYVFPDTDTFSRFLLQNFNALIIEDAFSTTEQDEKIFNHGQAETLFNLNQLVSDLLNADYGIYLIDSYPDYPSGTKPCHVIKLLALHSSIDANNVFDFMKNIGFEVTTDTRVNTPNVVQGLNNKLTQEQWKTIKYFKHLSPVWGKTPDSVISGNTSFKARLNKVFEHLLFRLSPWGNYKLKGEMAEKEISRQIKSYKD